MTKTEFLILMNKASLISFKFAEQYLTNKLIPEFRYDIFLNSSHDDSASFQFDLYPEDDGRVALGLEITGACDLLFRKGKTPVWIDIAVFKSDVEITTFKLICAGRYTNNEEELYYHERGMGPFGIKSPNLPYGFKEGQKFRL